MAETAAMPDDLLSTPPPSLTDAEAAALAWAHFGMAGTVARLTSERDLNFCLTNAAGCRFVLKLANPAEPPAVTHLQTSALLHLERVVPELAVPRVIRAQDGGTEVALAGRGILRLLSYLEGTPLHLVPRSSALRAAMGQWAARLAQGLRDFDHPAAGRELLWDIRQAAGLRPMLACIDAPEARALATRCLDQFEASVAPALPALRWQVGHNDLNPHNVLVDPADHSRICGVLDFGDMVRTPLVCDLAVAASYQIDAAAPLGSLAEFVAAYHAVCPLLPAEVAQLFDLIATRMATTITIASWRAARYPENRAYILRNFPAALAGLTAFSTLSRAGAQQMLARICGPGASR